MKKTAKVFGKVAGGGLKKAGKGLKFVGGGAFRGAKGVSKTLKKKVSGSSSSSSKKKNTNSNVPNQSLQKNGGLQTSLTNPGLNQAISDNTDISPSTFTQQSTLSSGGISQPFAQNTRQNNNNNLSQATSSQSSGGFSNVNFNTQPFQTAKTPRYNANTQPFQNVKTPSNNNSYNSINRTIQSPPPLTSGSYNFHNPYASNPPPPQQNAYNSTSQPYLTNTTPQTPGNNVNGQSQLFTQTRAGGHQSTSTKKFDEVRSVVKRKAGSGKIKDKNYKDKFKSVSTESNLRDALVKHFQRYVKDSKKPGRKHHQVDKAKSLISYIEGDPSIRSINTRMLSIASSYFGKQKGSFMDRLHYAIYKTEQFIAPLMTSAGSQNN